MYPKREVFPSSPLALVAAEIRFSDAPRLRQPETLDSIAVAVESLLPVHERVQGTVNIQVVNGQPQIQVATGRLMKRAAAPKAASQSLRRSIDLAWIIRPFITTDVMQITAVVVSARSAVVQ